MVAHIWLTLVAAAMPVIRCSAEFSQRSFKRMAFPASKWPALVYKVVDVEVNNQEPIMDEYIKHL
jgi:hypothetical protein